MGKLQFIWNADILTACTKVPEDQMTEVVLYRASCGMEINRKTGERAYFVPAHIMCGVIDKNNSK